MSGKLPFGTDMLTVGKWQAYAPAKFLPLGSMAERLPPDVISKPDALEKYQKPERTFQRRLSKALRTRDEAFLSHFHLATTDGVV